MEQISKQLASMKTPVIELMRSHRSIRSFLPDPIPEGWVETIIASAQWASSTCFRQMYSVIAVQDPEKKRMLMEVCGKQRWVEACPVFLAFCLDVNRLDELCKQRGLRVNLDHLESLLAAVLDVGLFMQNAALAAESLGLGIVMIGGMRNDPREVGRLLQLPQGVFCVSGMCLGFPMVVPDQRPRLPLDEVLHWDVYRQEGRFERLADYDEIIRKASVYRSRQGEEQGWTDIMARTTSKPLTDEGRIDLRNVLLEAGFGLE